MALFDLSHAALEIVAIGGVPAYLALQGWTLFALRDGCRFAALLPILLAISLIASAAEGFSTHVGPSPLTLMLFAPAAAAYLGGLVGLSAMLRRVNWHDSTHHLA
jgi:uncharacterized protein involved in cysteine biosynthesis